jgi:threonine dehydrogenase-like Zn-dependent dehydrogenase
MRAVVTTDRAVMEVLDLPEPGEPGPGEVIVRPQAVGICGSDFHYFLGEIGDQAQFPRIQGHEVGAVVESVGPDCSRGLSPGDSVALHPLSYCGKCYPCRIGRTNVCDNFSLIGIHTDGGFQEQLRMPEDLVFPTSASRPAVAALAEPLSIAVRAINRSRLSAGEHAVIFGAGPIGQAICLLARERDAPVLMIDPVAGRLEIGAGFGAETMPWSDDVIEVARDW